MDQLERRTALLEQRIAEHRLTDRYARFYAPFAVLAVVLSFMPLLNDTTDGNIKAQWGTIWNMAARPGGAPAQLAILLMAALVVLLILATLGNPAPVLPILIASDAALIFLMLLTKPGTGTFNPTLTHAGNADLALSAAIALTATLQAIQLLRKP